MKPYSMSRHRLDEFDYADSSHAYFITLRAKPGKSPFREHELASEVVASLFWLRKNAGLVLYAYCLMPDHLHLLLQPKGNHEKLGITMRRFKTFTTRQSWKLGLSGPLWQERFHDHIVRKAEDGHAIAQYIVDNPARKGLVKVGAEYEWIGLPDPM